MSISVKEKRFNAEVSVRKAAGAASPVARLQVNGISARLSKGATRRGKGDRASQGRRRRLSLRRLRNQRHPSPVTKATPPLIPTTFATETPHGCRFLRSEAPGCTARRVEVTHRSRNRRVTSLALGSISRAKLASKIGPLSNVTNTLVSVA